MSELVVLVTNEEDLEESFKNSGEGKRQSVLGMHCVQTPEKLQGILGFFLLADVSGDGLIIIMR